MSSQVSKGLPGMMLTAGLGTRLRPITTKWAKPAVPFLGIPLLKYPLHLMRAAGIQSLVLNSHYLPEQIVALGASITTPDFPVHVSEEPGAPLGAGGGIWKARKWLDTKSATGTGDFLVCNGDEVILPHDPQVLSKFSSAHTSSDALGTILVMKHPLVGTQFGGVWCSPAGDVRGFGKDGSKFGADAIGYHYIGVLMLNSRIFKFLPEGESNILYDGLASAIADGEKVRVVVSEFTWFETGNPHDLLEATHEALKLLAVNRGFLTWSESGLTESAGLREAAVELDAVCTSNWEPGTILEKRGDALILRVAGAALASDISVRGFAVIEKGAHVLRGASLDSVIVMPDGTVSTPLANQIVI